MKPSASGADRQRLGNLIGHAQAAIGYARAHGRGWWRSAETLDAVLMREGRDATPRVVGDDRAAAAATTRIEVGGASSVSDATEGVKEDPTQEHRRAEGGE